MESEWLNIEDAAKYLGISLSNLYAMAQTNRIPAHRLGKVWRFHTSELDSWIRTNKPINEFFTSVDFDVDENECLRIPQREAYSAAYEFFQKGGRKAIIQLPVGCGKSGLISILPLGIVKGRVLVIAPNLTIKEELSKVLSIANKRMCFWGKCNILTKEVMQTGPYVAILDSVDANIHDCDQSHFVVTNIQQLASSADKWLPQFSDDYFDMILVDEGHHNAAPSWKKVFDKFPKAKVVSLTATPFRSDEQAIEGELIYKYPFKSAMIKGYIKKLQAIYVTPKELYFTYRGDQKHYSLKDVLELKEEEWFSRGVALSKVCNENIVNASLEKLELLRKSGTHHQIIAVACSVDHAKEIRSLYAERGFQAKEIHSNMPALEQEKVLQDLRSGALDCIVQVFMLGEGFDHPKLSVAAIFRPFRTLSPYVQFVGRIMRVIVQNDSRHPDNYGYIVTHIGLNLDKQLDDFRQLDSEDENFFKDLLDGKEPDLPPEVLDGSARKRIKRHMVVNDEIVDSFLQEDFIDPDDEVLQAELKSFAESLGFDADGVMEFLKNKKTERTKQVLASLEYPIIPQLQRQEARKRLAEIIKSSAKILLNRLGFSMAGSELQFSVFPGNVSGNNFAAAVQLINHEVNRRLNIVAGERGKLRVEDYKKAMEEMDDIVNVLTRRAKKKKEDKDE
ncbi:MAG: DEAD/DEAH box helicase family protein [Candidatus Omnitrophica bacterium]|jgi:superfamily II DNA or RNA helicase|nr:DEAD/DEAH box helicase family protein [Candidatus Omnitrophota bacterium]